ncbi:PREDICTED: uncharacterized protein LOC104825644 [Tarenaya hassleriana]|uniref:uncharacterized protein LOC104825644 n=1 Tax=Tarenaya hassleriana TaxID=28532 RepID=UPI00053C29DE|nr:PREDICTED: uncharacterized protein LOC104825644 [Tarenaya hassleriana]
MDVNGSVNVHTGSCRKPDRLNMETGLFGEMGCGVSRPETEEEGGEFKMVITHRSIHSRVVADSFTLNRQFLGGDPSPEKESKPNGSDRTENAKKDGAEMESDRGSSGTDVGKDDCVPENSILLCPRSPSFRIYCDILLDHDDHVDKSDDSCDRPVSQKPLNKCQSNVKKEKVRRRETRRTRIGRRIKNVRKLLNK